MSGLSRARRLSWSLVLAAWLSALQRMGAAWAQTPGVAKESAVKAAFLSKFAGFVEWPPEALGRPGQPLVIGVVGSEAVATDLAQIIQSRSAGSSEVVLRLLHDGDSLADVNMLYIGPTRPGRVRELTAAVHGPVLIVTDQEDGLRLGGVLNFIVDAGRVRFAASVPAAEARGLRLSARLLAVAQVVEVGGR